MEELLDTVSSDSVVYQPIELTQTTVDIPDNWETGLEGSSKQNSIEENSGILTVIVLLFILILLNFKDCKKLFSRYIEELRNNKKRENAFDEHTNNESRLNILTIFQYIAYGGFLLYEIAEHSVGQYANSAYNYINLLYITLLFAAYYIFQTVAYSVVGYTFTTKEDTSRWLRAFNASQALAGVFIIIPSLIILFYPSTFEVMSAIAIVSYFLCRLSFIIKGFSIFYDNIFSLIYFILYLCSLEIIPVIFMYKLALLIV